jgi:transposase-like protein
MGKGVKKKRGPKPRFLDIACPNPECKLFALTGHENVISNGTYRTRSTGKARLFLCRTCGKAFSSRTGTAFSDLRSSKKKVLWALQLVATGSSLRGTSRQLKVKLDTIRRWVTVAASHHEQINEMLRKDRKLSQVQADKLWTFVKKNTRIPLAR